MNGEGYSKESYNEAADANVSAEQNWQFRNEVFNRHPENMLTLYNEISRNRDESRERIEKLYGKGQAEANALNEEYDHLMAKALEAVKALMKFEKEKLGMSAEETKS